MGLPLSVSVSFVLLFVVYGTFMDTAGAGNFWLDLSLATMGRTSASAGRGAIITTALLGGPQASGVGHHDFRHSHHVAHFAEGRLLAQHGCRPDRSRASAP